MSLLKPVPFYFLRHGETDWNQRRIIQGQTDTDLNQTGEQQAAYVAAHVAALDVTTICCSTLLRACRTAEIVNRERRLSVLHIANLMECSFGEVEGQPSNGDWVETWRQGGPMPGGETYDTYTRRILRAFNEALEQPGPVLIVSHGGNFWALEHHGLIPPGPRVPNCGLFRLEPPASDSKYWHVKQLAAPPGVSLAIGEATAP